MVYNDKDPFCIRYKKYFPEICFSPADLPEAN